MGLTIDTGRLAQLFRCPPSNVGKLAVVGLPTLFFRMPTQPQRSDIGFPASILHRPRDLLRLHFEDNRFDSPHDTTGNWKRINPTGRRIVRRERVGLETCISPGSCTSMGTLSTCLVVWFPKQK